MYCGILTQEIMKTQFIFFPLRRLQILLLSLLVSLLTYHFSVPVFTSDLVIPTSSAMAEPILHPETNHHHHHHIQPLKEIAIDYTPEACSHCPNSNSIALTFDHRGGARWRTTTRFLYGTFSALIQCPKGNTNGLNFNIYLSSLEGDKSQDEIDFEFLGKDKTIVQTNFYTRGTGNREQIHDLGFDCSDGFHEYVIKWGRDSIEWVIDGKVVRREENKEGGENGELGFPEKPMFLYASIWDASYIDNGNWTGKYDASDAPYVCRYKDIHVPIATACDS